MARVSANAHTRQGAAVRIQSVARRRLAVTSRLVRACQAASREVQRELGIGWKEKTYQEALKFELHGRGYHARCEVVGSVVYKGVPLGGGACFRADMLVTDPSTRETVLVEMKADSASPAFLARSTRQMRRYLEAIDEPVAYGVLVVFHTEPVTTRVVRACRKSSADPKRSVGPYNDASPRAPKRRRS